MTESQTQQTTKTQPLTKALASYVHTRIVGELVFVAGQGCRDPKTNNYRGLTRTLDGQITNVDIREQAAGVLDNIEKALSAHNLSRSDIVDVTVFLKSMDYFQDMNMVWNGFFKDSPLPTRTTVAVADLPGDNYVEMKAIAKLRSN
jgi:reactive intermediate/imine deaminase